MVGGVGGFFHWFVASFEFDKGWGGGGIVGECVHGVGIVHCEDGV